mmetsp:Transcript_28660/g.89105  ORF Transcript_28660/g.89105 Transcript_28660/m.89105 type:complete len:261 (-) Transcript_28660:209-991(-)
MHGACVRACVRCARRALLRTAPPRAGASQPAARASCLDARAELDKYQEEEDPLSDACQARSGQGPRTPPSERAAAAQPEMQRGRPHRQNVVVEPPVKVGGGLGADARVGGVADALLNLVQDALRQRVEDVLNVLAGQRAGLQEQDVLLLGEPARLKEGDLSLLLEVALVADGYDGDVLPSLLPGVLEPRGQVVVRVSRGDVVQDQRSDGASVVRARHGTIALLTRRVPDLQLDLAIPQGDDLGAKLHADRVRRLLSELAL